MERITEKEISLPKVALQLATIKWSALEKFVPLYTGYHICQRLSDCHSAVRISNFAAREVFPRAQSVAFLPPGFAVDLHPVDRPLRVLNCVFDKDFFEDATQIDQAYWDQHSGSLVSIKDRRIESMMQEMYAELMQPGFGHDLLIEAASTMMLVEIGRYGRRVGDTAGTSAGGQGLAPWQLRRIHERIEASLEMGYPSLSELAQLCSISRSHLMRTFKASTGWQIHKYVAEKRLRAAMTLLERDDLAAKEIAAKLGFRSPAYFATAFRKMTSKSPTEYRRKARAMKVKSI